MNFEPYALKCKQGHDLKSETRYFNCDECQKEYHDVSLYCQTCDYDLCKSCEQLQREAHAFNPSNTSSIKIIVNIPEENKYLDLNCKKTDSISHVRDTINKENTPKSENYCLKYNQQLLEDCKLLADYDITKTEDIFLYYNS